MSEEQQTATGLVAAIILGLIGFGILLYLVGLTV